MNSTVSIVVPAFNNAAYIERTMDSILAQTHHDLEIIVADHASTDSTWETLQRYAVDPRVTLLTTEAGGGALANWNRVSQAATGDFIKLVCGDDLIYPELVAEQYEALTSHPKATLTASARDIIDANDDLVLRNRGLAGLSGPIDGRAAVRQTIVSGTNIFGEPGCVMMRRKTLEKVGWWDSTFPYLIDETTYSRVLFEGDFIAVPRSLAGFRISESQWSVRLAKSQSTQAAAFHHWVFNEYPGVISRADLVRGNLAASAMAILRRLAYIVLKHRMSLNENHK
ncbi:glycosyltransferase family A protein [Frigoribacterium sp. CG_9.8]|uniref:glycosyltransferase family 2 protein n=1 Tax=Frigoribacterium sp. CG_9.8 TaxID=2787733 RepID=UPI0018CB5F89|nr:glycosyltransferase involved in cell wall biosynthesis [Frigoribacterium sp. CG_9.8]